MFLYNYGLENASSDLNPDNLLSLLTSLKYCIQKLAIEFSLLPLLGQSDYNERLIKFSASRALHLGIIKALKFDEFYCKILGNNNYGVSVYLKQVLHYSLYICP